MKNFIMALSLLISVAAKAETYGSRALKILSAVDQTSDFVNSDQNATGINSDPEFLRNQFKMLLEGALGGDIVGYGDIKVAFADCNQEAVSYNCFAVLSFNNGRNNIKYSFSSAIRDTLKSSKVIVTNLESFIAPRHED